VTPPQGVLVKVDGRIMMDWQVWRGLAAVVRGLEGPFGMYMGCLGFRGADSPCCAGQCGRAQHHELVP